MRPIAEQYRKTRDPKLKRELRTEEIKIIEKSWKAQPRPQPRPKPQPQKPFNKKDD